MLLDEPTLMLALGICSITASAMFFTIYACTCHRAGLRMWAFGSLFVGFAILIDAPRAIENWQLASLLFNIPLFIGQALFLTGTAQFVGRPFSKSALLILVGTVVLLTTIFTFIVPNTVGRIFSLASFQAGINSWTAFLLWRHAESGSRRVYAVASLITFVEALTSAAQAFFVFVSADAITYATPQLPIANLITWLGTMLNVVLGNWILFLLIMLRLINELKALAGSDTLTGLLNRRGLRLHVDALLNSNEPVRSLTVLLLDIDHFKRINDNYGHDTGDSVLATMGDILRGIASSHIFACRWGGEEFCVVATGLDESTIVELADSIRLKLFQLTSSNPKLTSGVTVSIGAAVQAISGQYNFSTLISVADKQLYIAKHSGRNRTCVTELYNTELF